MKIQWQVRGSRCNCGTSLRGTRTGLGPSPWANSGDWKFEVRDRAANWASGDPFQAVSNLRARRDPQNAAVSASHGEVSELRECVAGAGGASVRTYETLGNAGVARDFKGLTGAPL